MNGVIIVQFVRFQLWAFRMLPAIEALFARKDYPKHYPNTVEPLYSAAVQSKYEFTQLTVLKNPFKTKYFCWIDIGYFRDISSKHLNDSGTFSMYLPPGFMNDSVAYQQVYNRDVTASAKAIFDKNLDWLAGGLFIAEAQVMLHWTREHKVWCNDSQTPCITGLLISIYSVSITICIDSDTIVDSSGVSLANSANNLQ
jgi:Bacterial protein of unknown function (HtrL_YibB)